MRIVPLYLIILTAAQAPDAEETAQAMLATHAELPETFQCRPVSLYRRFRVGDDFPGERGAQLQAAAGANETAWFQVVAGKAGGGEALRVVFEDLKGPGVIEADAGRFLFGEYVYDDRLGKVCDPLMQERQRPLPPDRAQPIWIGVDVPADAAPGAYAGTVEVRCADEAVALRLTLEVLPFALPDRRDSGFYLDLWQHPGALARYHNVPVWSEAHWRLIETYAAVLADAGQKPITAIIMHDPWSNQTYDPHPSMVEWIREPDGSFTFDFGVFDRFVETSMRAGLPGPINCYSTTMGPGGRMDCPIRYWDRDAARYDRLDATVGDEAYREAWRQFFAALVPHLRERGWLDNACAGIDEAPAEKMQVMLEVIPDEMRVALAGNYHAELDARIYDYCVIYPGAPEEAAATRREEGKVTTFYTCCGPAFPNTFTFSPPIESRLLGWHALNIGGDGYLRWAAWSWPDAPLQSSVYAPWPAGDTFLIYPGPTTSIRFELLKKGIDDFAAWRAAKERRPDDPRLAEALELANRVHDGRQADPAHLAEARRLVNAVLSE